MKVVTVPCHFDNYSYILVCEKSGEAAIVDPAEYYPVYTKIEELGCKVTSILCTHHHSDHIGGLEDFRLENPTLQIFGHIEDEKRITGLNRPVIDRDAIRIGQLEGQVIHTPGHTSGSICYLFEDTLFTGDTVFGAGCGRLFEGSPDQMYSSFATLIDRVPSHAKIYFGHEYTLQNLKFAEFIEPENQRIQERIRNSNKLRDNNTETTPSKLSEEVETNPFFRCTVESVINSVIDRLFAEPSTPQKVFAALRKQKDSF